MMLNRDYYFDIAATSRAAPGHEILGEKPRTLEVAEFRSLSCLTSSYRVFVYFVMQT